MKRFNLWITIACMAMTFVACKSNKTNKDAGNEANVEETIMSGSDKDEHGCIGSAGYMWSELKQDCVRPFEIGLKINGIAKNNNYATYVIFASDSLKAELFAPGNKGGILLERIDNTWKNDTISVVYDNGEWSLSK